MSPEFNQKARQIFEEALELPPTKRLRFLDFACADSAEVRQEVTRMLEAYDRQTPAGAGFHAPPLRIQRINRYLIKSELGKGAMGAVYEAEDSVIGRTVALKVLHTHTLTDQSEAKALEDRLFREASSAGRLAHPGIVTVFDVGKEGDVAFIAMERVEGPTLQQVMRKGRMDRVQALDILRQAALALDYAHAAGIIHRDIKPANIMLHRGTQAKIADFGIAKVNAMSRLTVAGTILGTPSYMSPEQIQNLNLTGRSDQFSLAVVAYEMLTGARPFVRDTVAALLLSVVNGERPAASAIDPTLSPLVDEVLRMALSKSPEERFATCLAFINALSSATGIELPTLSGVATGAQTRTQPTAPILKPPPPVAATPPPLAMPAPSPRKGAPVGLAIGGGLLLLTLAAAYPVYRYTFPKPEGGAETRPPDSPQLFIPKVQAAPGAPVVSLFTAEPERIQPGSTATLRWWVTDAAEVVLNHDIGKVAGKGSIEVKPQKETEYILTATGPGGDVTARVTVGVGPDNPRHSVSAGPGAATPVPPQETPHEVPRQAPTEVPQVDTARAQQLYSEAVAKHRGQAGAEAASLFEQAARLGEPRAMLELGKMYSAGDGVGKNATEAARWYGKAADLGNASAMVFLGALYAQGAGVPKDLPQAAKWLRKAADAGNAVAMDGLGQMYASGQGVPVDATEAVAWYRKAANAGNAPAMYHLGLLLENGAGPVAKNAAEASQLYQRAAAAGYAPAKAKAVEAGPLTLTALEPPIIVENKFQLYRLIGSGFSANTTVRTDLESSIGSREGEKSNFRPVAVAPNGNWLAIYISLPAPQGRNTVKVLAKNPGAAEVALDVPIQR